MDDLRTFDLILMQVAAEFDLTSRDSRKRSAQLLGDLFIRLQLALNTELILEIGAHEAKFSRSMRKASSKPMIVALEANPDNFHHYTKTQPFAELNIEYLHLAASDKTGDVDFQVNPTIAGNTSLLDRVDLSYPDKVKVPSTTIADLVSARGWVGKSTSCWIDVEGAAGRVLPGFGSLTGQCLSFLIEVEDTPKWDGQWLRRQVSEFFYARGFLPVARDFEWTPQYNMLFLKAELLDDPVVRATLTNYFARLGQEARAAAPKSRHTTASPVDKRNSASSV